MTRPRAIQRNLLRVAVMAGVTAVVVTGGAVVQGQPSGPATMPTVNQTVAVPASNAPAPAQHGMSTSGSGAREHEQMGEATVNATTQRCQDSSRSESRLGLMENTALYSHCDYP